MKLASLVLTLAAVACTDTIPDETGRVAEDLRCPSWGCGSNSPTVGDGLLFDELDRTGVTPNVGGIVLVGATAADGTPVKIGVQRHVLRADALDGSRSYQHAALVGTIIKFKNVTDATFYEVLVSGVDEKSLRFWAGANEAVPAYLFMTRRLGEPKFSQYACKYDVLVDEPVWAGVQHHAIVFEGDRYDPARKLVSDAQVGDPFFNIACAATAPAKLHLMRHTRAGGYTETGALAYPTTWKERQAMLKMFAADYCGTGQPFTVDGQPLVYDDANHWYSSRSAPRTFAAREALWGPNGALCLDAPRLVSRPVLRADVETACGFALPRCSFAAWETRAHVMSALSD